MVFSSPIFMYAFLPALLLTYFGLRHELRNTCLLLSSLLFYAWGEGLFILLMLVSVSVNYVLGLVVDKFRGHASAKWVVALACIINLSFLGWHKYANFAVHNVNRLLSMVGLDAIELDPVHLPIGISFFTFQALSYIIDVYRGEAKAQRNPLRVALYIALFPQLIAGPIVRFRDVAEQIVDRVTSASLFVSGIHRFTIGLGKKLLIANALAVPADQIFAIPSDELTFGLAWFGVLCYTLQIYFDFSGYSDMAIGLGRMFGFRFLENFNYPYISKSMTEFWRRWHISLSSWFRDYLYIPLGGNRGSLFSTYRNLFIVFFVTGLWHGASWNFIVWGMYHGAFLVMERLSKGRLPFTPPRFVRHAYVLFAVMIGWVFFRAESLTHAMNMLAVMAGLGPGEEGVYYLGVYLYPYLLTALAAGIIGAVPWLPELNNAMNRLCVSRRGVMKNITEGGFGIVRIACLSAVLIACAMVLSAQTHNPFIYFRF